MAKNVQGAALTGLGRYAEAEKLLLASLPALAGSPIADLPERGRERLAELYTAWGKPEEAAKYARTDVTASHNAALGARRAPRIVMRRPSRLMYAVPHKGRVKRMSRRSMMRAVLAAVGLAAATAAGATDTISIDPDSLQAAGCFGLTSCTVEGANVSSVGGTLAKKIQNGAAGFGVNGGPSGGEIDIGETLHVDVRPAALGRRDQGPVSLQRPRVQRQGREGHGDRRRHDLHAVRAQGLRRCGGGLGRARNRHASAAPRRRAAPAAS